MSQKKKNILLLTATITPPQNAPLLKRVDPNVRLCDYEKALAFYLTLLDSCIDSIIFVENSNSDISRLRDIVNKNQLNNRVEFLVFDGLDYPPSFDRAYGEFKLIQYAMDYSQTICSNSNTEMIIWKVSGRYIIRNLNRIISRKPLTFDIYCNFRKIPKRWAEMYLLAWNLKGYNNCLRNIYHDLKPLIIDDIRIKDPEELFIDLLQQSKSFVAIVPRFNVTPMVDGVRGWTNQNFLEGRDLLKYYIRWASNILFPWFWI
jgi:hypothetical protein